MDFLWFLLIGGVAGAISGRIMRGKGVGCLGNISVGIIGAVIGGFLLPLLGVATRGSIGSLVSATVGALVLLWILGINGRRK